MSRNLKRNLVNRKAVGKLDDLFELTSSLVKMADKATVGGTKGLIKRLDNFVDTYLLKFSKPTELLKFLKSNSKLNKLYSQYGRGKGLITWLRKTDSTQVKAILIEKYGKKWEEILGRTKQIIKLKELPLPSTRSKDKLKNLVKSYKQYVLENANERLLKNLFGIDKIGGLKGLSLADSNKLDDINSLLQRSDKDVLQHLVHRVKGNLGELLVLDKRLEHLMEYAKTLSKKYDEIAYYPKIWTDYQNLDETAIELSKMTTDGVIIGKLKGKRRYEILDFAEVKTSQGGAADALFQIHRRGEKMGEDGILKVIFESDKYVIKDGKIVWTEIKDPITLNYSRDPKLDGIFGFHTAKKRIFAPSDRLSIKNAEGFNTTNPVKKEDIQSIGLTWEETESLATYIVAYFARSK